MSERTRMWGGSTLLRAYLLGGALLGGGLLGASAPAAAAPDEDRYVAIKAGAVITVSGEEYRPGTVVIRNGKVEAVGVKVEIPPKARVIEAGDETVMPGIVSPRSRFGLSSYKRTGNNAALTVLPELFLRPGHFGELLAAGVVAVGLIPAGEAIPGQAVVLRPLDGEPGDLVMDEARTYLRVGMRKLPGDKRTLRSAFKAAQQAIDREAKARKDWEAKQAKAAKEKAAKEKAAKEKAEKEKKAPPKPAPKKPAPKKPAPTKPAPKKGDEKKPAAFKAPPISPKLAPFVAVLRKEPAPRFLIELGRASDLVHFEDAFGDHELDSAFYLSLGDESDFFHAVPALGEARATCLLPPRISFEPYTRTRRNLPAELERAGCTLVFVPTSDAASGHRELLAEAALLVREGLPRAAALAALTRNPAAFLGLEDLMGSIQAGRRADLIFLDGDPFAPGARVTRVMLEGELVQPEEAR